MEFNATFLVSAISFILFTFIMNKIFYKPLEKVMTERELFINDTLNSAKYSNDKADAILKDRDDKLNKSLSDSKKIISEKLNETNKNASVILADAKNEYRQNMDEAKENLAKDENELNEALKPQIKQLAGAISSKLLGFETEVEDL